MMYTRSFLQCIVLILTSGLLSSSTSCTNFRLKQGALTPTKDNASYGIKSKDKDNEKHNFISLNSRKSLASFGNQKTSSLGFVLPGQSKENANILSSKDQHDIIPRCGDTWSPARKAEKGEEESTSVSAEVIEAQGEVQEAQAKDEEEEGVKVADLHILQVPPVDVLSSTISTAPSIGIPPAPPAEDLLGER